MTSAGLLNRRTVTVVLVVALMGFFFLGGTSNEDLIRQRLEAIRKLSQISATLHPMEQLSLARRLSKFFSEPVTFDLTNAGYHSISLIDRQEFVQRSVPILTRITSLETAMQRIKVSVADDTAEVQMTVSGLGSTRSGSELFLEVHRIRLSFKEADGEWVISEVVHLRNERDIPE